MSEALTSLPSKWQLRPIGDLGEWSGGQTPFKSNPSYWQEGHVLWVSPKDIIGPLISDSEDKITELALDNTRLRHYPITSVMVVVRSGILRHRFPVARCTKQFTVNQDLKVLVPNVETDPQFVFFMLTYLGPTILRRVVKAGTTVESVDIPSFLKLEIPTPPLPQQRKIARILTTVDNLIEKTEALTAKYQAIKQGMMHDLFTRGVDEHGHLRPYYEEAPELYKQSELGWIPKEWSVRSLGEVAVVGGGVTLGRDLAGSQVVELPYLRVANVQDGYLDLSEIKTVSVLKSEVDRYRLEQGDMLMTEGGDFDKLGRGTVWRGQISSCLHQNHIFRVRPSKEFILPDFLAAVTASSYGKRYFLVSSKQTTNLATINSTQLKAFPVPLPNLYEQGRMIAAIASVERQIEAEQRHSNQMKQTKTGLMQDLLTGKVRVKADEDGEISAHA